MIVMCHCGQPLHYSDPAVRRKIEALMRDLGPNQVVHLPGKGTWLVPRHYIALHGLKATEVASLGFQKVRLP